MTRKAPAKVDDVRTFGVSAIRFWLIDGSVSPISKNGRISGEGGVGQRDTEINTVKQNSRRAGVEESGIDVGKQKNKGKEAKREIKWASGLRNVWGTRKKDSCNEVAKEMDRAVGKMGSELAVRKQVAELNG